ncbi:MAG: hypothetical protein ABIH28_00685 [archaeon]
MKKQGIIFASILVLLTGIISAYSYSPSSIGQLFESMGGENIGLLIIFSVSFALITVILNRTDFFGENKAASTIISLMLTLGITYGVYKQGITLDFSGIFYNLGVSDFALDIIVFLVTIIIIIFFFVKLRSAALLFIGGFMLATYIILGLSVEIGIVGGALIIVWILFRYVLFRSTHTVYGMKNKYNFNPKFYSKK